MPKRSSAHMRRSRRRAACSSAIGSHPRLSSTLSKIWLRTHATRRASPRTRYSMPNWWQSTGPEAFRHCEAIMRYALLLIGLFVAAGAHGQLAPNAPADQPQALKPQDVEAFEAAIAPYIAEARKTYPEAKQRYLDKLPPGH